MKYYFVEHYYDKGAPFGASSMVKLYLDNDLIAIHEHIHYDQIKGYCKCLEDLGYEEIRNYDNVEWLIDKCKKAFTDEDISIIGSWFELTGNWPTE